MTTRRSSGLAVLLLGGAAVLALAAIGHPVAASGAVRPDAPGTVAVPAPTLTAAVDAPTETAVFSGGCFWGVQGVFQHVRGVLGTTAGFDGGARDTAHYEDVSTGTTGHAESVRITFNPQVVSYATLLRVFFSAATDPTQVDHQFPDSGTQYRSMIWTNTAAQARVATAYIHQLDAAHVFAAPIATVVAPDHGFYPAEAYHQNYLVENPDSLYIATYDEPKIATLKQVLPADWRAAPVLAPAVSGNPMRSVAFRSASDQ